MTPVFQQRYLSHLWDPTLHQKSLESQDCWSLLRRAPSSFTLSYVYPIAPRTLREDYGVSLHIFCRLHRPENNLDPGVVQNHCRSWLSMLADHNFHQRV